MGIAYTDKRIYISIQQTEIKRAFSRMKIGILTHPFQGNYGGMLQAYALFQILRRKEHEAVILGSRP